MDSRRAKILAHIIEEYIATAAPVGSGPLAEKYFSDLSSATIRNDMAALEEEGYIYQPHVSAGRIPTLDGYRYYIDHLLDRGRELTATEERALRTACQSLQGAEAVKAVAKAMAETADSAVLVGFGPMDVYYTGISNVFRQPEFSQHALVYSMSAIIDHLDETMTRIYNDMTDDIRVLLGDDNPFGSLSSVIMTRYRTSDSEGLVGILGPSRMDYARNMALVRTSQRLLAQLAK